MSNPTQNEETQNEEIQNEEIQNEETRSEETLQKKLARLHNEYPSFGRTPDQTHAQIPSPSRAPTFGASSWTGFLFLPSYRESFDYLVLSGHPDKAYKFLEAVVIYGTEGVDVSGDDVLIAAVMAQVKPVINKYREKYKKEKREKTPKK